MFLFVISLRYSKNKEFEQNSIVKTDLKKLRKIIGCSKDNNCDIQIIIYIRKYILSTNI